MSIWSLLVQRACLPHCSQWGQFRMTSLIKSCLGTFLCQLSAFQRLPSLAGNKNTVFIFFCEVPLKCRISKRTCLSRPFWNQIIASYSYKLVKCIRYSWVWGTAWMSVLTFCHLIKGLELLYQPEVVRLYLSLLTCSHNHNTLEAAAGALQNLAAGQWAVSN